ncbi:HAD family phosphatase [Galbitalea sp. SE-J8]|uniref:HAD family hydrolase n=1 Tax=Galbitalea sp. SE-J8 TaxID=3054952 RepID=UPI00259CDC41|nr:HAD family phosphatase [Galbitalea sp. SE-J8]MDM4764018.1 HAD family phosphatase [Galbitalea sp. SE-J8]
MTTPFPAAVLWDMDGTIVDTEPYWLASETELVESFGGTWSIEQGLQLVGAPLLRSAQVLRAAGVDLSAESIVNALTERVLEKIADAVPWQPGAVELLTALRERGIPSALVTMSIGRMAHRIAGALPFAPFRVIVAGDQVQHGKPHPEAYLRATELLGVEPRDCLAIEDSDPGMRSAASAGTVVIGVPAHVPVAAGIDHVRWEGGLAGRTIADLQAAFAAGRVAEGRIA